MRFTVLCGLLTAALALAPAGPVEAQQAGHPGAPGSADRAHKPPPAGPAVPARLMELLDSHNRLRARYQLPPLDWSTTLAAEALAAAGKAASGACTPSAVDKAAADSRSNVYWSSPVRSIDGASAIQDVRPPFVVSEWRSGASLERMLAAESHAAGCAVQICPSQGQVWVCRYGP